MHCMSAMQPPCTHLLVREPGISTDLPLTNSPWAVLALSSFPGPVVVPLGPLCARVEKKSFEPRSTLSPKDAYGEGVGGSPSRLMLVEAATVPVGGAPKSSERGLEAVCRVSLGGDGENGRAERGMEGGVSGAAAAGAVAPAVLGSSMRGKAIIGMGRDQCK
jgi:hypothetical protein